MKVRKECHRILTVFHIPITANSPFHHFTISPFHYMNWFTISPFQHLVLVSFHHLTISVCLSYTISLDKVSHHLSHPLYQYYILKDHLSDYSESDESGVDRYSPEYTNVARKYYNYLNITPYLLNNSPKLNSSRTNIYARSKNSRSLVAAKLPLSRTIASQGDFVCMPLIMAMECVLVKH